MDKYAKRARNALKEAKIQLKDATDILEDSIVINNSFYKSDKFDDILEYLNSYINTINNKIIPGLQALDEED